METPSTASQKQNLERLSEGAQQTVDSLSEKANEFLAMQEDWVEGAREYVREHPIAALGMALATGYLLSMLTRR